MARIEIKSEITGTVWEVKAQPGDKVDSGDILLMHLGMTGRFTVLSSGAARNLGDLPPLARVLPVRPRPSSWLMIRSRRTVCRSATGWKDLGSLGGKGTGV